MTHDVNRWHAHKFAELRNCGDTVKAHSQRVYWIAIEIVALGGRVVVSPDLTKACLHHDDPETIMGDWPATLTRDYRIARWAKAILEWQIKRKLGLRWRLTRQEKLILALADKLDAYEVANQNLTTAQMMEFDCDLRGMYRIAAKLGPEVGNWLYRRLEGAAPKSGDLRLVVTAGKEAAMQALSDAGQAWEAEA